MLLCLVWGVGERRRAIKQLYLDPVMFFNLVCWLGMGTQKWHVLMFLMC